MSIHKHLLGLDVEFHITPCKYSSVGKIIRVEFQLGKIREKHAFLSKNIKQKQAKSDQKERGPIVRLNLDQRGAITIFCKLNNLARSSAEGKCFSVFDMYIKEERRTANYKNSSN